MAPEETKAVSTPISGIKDIVAKAKEVKARKEGLKFLIKVAELNQRMKEAEENLNKFVADEGLSKDIIEEAKSLTQEDIEAIREFIDETRKLSPPTWQHSNLVAVNPMYTSMTNGTAVTYTSSPTF